MTPALRALRIAADPAAWRRLGFTVSANGRCILGGVLVELAGTRDGAGVGITGWTLEGVDPAAPLDGLPAPAGGPAAATPEDVPKLHRPHPNTASRIDHVVVFTPDAPRTLRVLQDAGLDLRRVRDTAAAGRPVQQGFFWIGAVLLEVAGPPLPQEDSSEGPAALWGLTVVVEDLPTAAALAGDHLGAPRDAVQPGRRIATVRPAAGAGAPLAFITPHRSNSSGSTSA